MPGQPPDGWYEIVRFFQNVDARFVEIREAVNADHERFDDWTREQEHKREMSQTDVTRQLQFLGRTVEETVREFKAHLNSQKLKDAEARRESTTLNVARMDNRTKLILALLALVQFVIGLVVGRGSVP